MLGDRTPLTGVAGPIVSLAFAAFTAAVLVIDLERPERFYYILTRPNWTSWLARGAFLLTAHGAIAGAWIALHFAGQPAAISMLAPVAFAMAVAATAYTGFLFAQGLARDLWQGPHSTIDLVAQAVAEGSAAMLVVSLFIGGDATTIRGLALSLALASVAHLAILVLENLLTPSPTVHHELAVRAVRSGPYRALFWIGALGMGGLVPLLSVWFASTTGFSLTILVPAALVALAGCLAWEYIWVEAGQSVPNS
jgi:formate-dependent nitrite reductase membrane component NrfD